MTVMVESNHEALLEKIRGTAQKAFLNGLEFLTSDTVYDYSFGVATTHGERIELWENGVFRSYADNEANLLPFFISLLRVSVAERIRDKVFVHAGVVGVHDRAIVIPGNSFTGKTTLVAELVKRGADYLSDEYAVLDGDGFVHPFTRDLSIRVRGEREIEAEITAESLGGRKGTRPMSVGMVLITEYEPAASLPPETLTLGNGIKEMIPHTIPVRLNTEFALKVLNKTLERAIILKGSRGEALQFAHFLLSYIHNDLNWPIKAVD
ncbi:MAG: hypothetical protein ACR2IH_13005 [Pyrinomonadaceae bacterium]